MNLKRPYLLYICFISLLINGVSYAQEKTTKTDSIAEVKKTIQVTDSIVVLESNGDLSTTQIKTITKDALIFDLQNYSKAREADSLWMQELYNTSLFVEIYGSIINENDSLVDYEVLPTEVLKQRLKEIDARAPFNVEYNPSLENVIKNYLKNRRETIGKLIALSEYNFPMFEKELDRHNLPLEIKYLAVVKSALDPKAQSRVGAKGLWQFMFSTGKLFGLEVSSYVDERSDPEMATEAASKYLQSLYKSYKAIRWTN